MKPDATVRFSPAFICSPLRWSNGASTVSRWASVMPGATIDDQDLERRTDDAALDHNLLVLGTEATGVAQDVRDDALDQHGVGGHRWQPFVEFDRDAAPTRVDAREGPGDHGGWVHRSRRDNNLSGLEATGVDQIHHESRQSPHLGFDAAQHGVALVDRAVLVRAEQDGDIGLHALQRTEQVVRSDAKQRQSQRLRFSDLLELRGVACDDLGPQSSGDATGEGVDQRSVLRVERRPFDKEAVVVIDREVGANVEVLNRFAAREVDRPLAIVVGEDRDAVGGEDRSERLEEWQQVLV